MSNRAAVHQLESDFADAMNRMYAVGNGLARLRAELDREVVPPAAAVSAAPVVAAPVPSGVPVAAGFPVPSGVPVAAGIPIAAGPPRPATGSVPPPAASAQPRPTGGARPLIPPVPPGSDVPTAPFAPHVAWYRREGAVTRVLAVTGAVITLAGVAMLLVLAAQHGWFGPAARVGAGAALAAVLVGLGVRSGEGDRGRGGAAGSAAVALVATGAAAAYLVVVAVTSGYGWVPAGIGLVLSGIVALGGLQLARRWDSELLAVLMVLGAAALAPVVAQGGGWVVSAFLAVLCVAGWWAGGTHTRPALTVVRTVPVTLALLVGALDGSRGGADAIGHFGVALVVLAATLLTSAVSVRRDAHDVPASSALALVTTGFLAATSGLHEPGRTTALALGAAVLLLVATSLTRPPLGPVAGHLVVTVGTAGTVLAVLAVLSGAPHRFVTTGLLLLALAGLAAAGVTRSRTTLGLAAGTTVVAVLAWTPHPLAAITATTAASHDMAVALLDSILLGAVVATGLWAVGNQRGLGREVRLTATVLAWVLGLGASTTALVALGTLVGAEVGQTTVGFTVGHAVATVTWMAAAAWLLLRGLERSRDADLTLRTGLVLAGISVAKLFLYDLAALSGLVRSAAFIVVGLLLLATGSRYTKAYERSRLTA